MIDAVAEGIALDFFVDGEGAALVVVAEVHLRGIETGLAVDKVTNGGVFYNHAGPERVAREAEKVRAAVGGDLDDNIGPAGQDVVSRKNAVVW